MSSKENILYKVKINSLQQSSLIEGTNYIHNIIMQQIICPAINELQNFSILIKQISKNQKEGHFRESNPGPLAPKARIIPLDQSARLLIINKVFYK